MKFVRKIFCKNVNMIKILFKKLRMMRGGREPQLSFDIENIQLKQRLIY